MIILIFDIPGFALIASLLLAGLVYTSAEKNGNFNEKVNVETSTDAWQNPETCLGSCPSRDPENNSVLLQNKDCTKYCICGGGEATVNVCPEGLHFSLEDQVCTWPSDVNCKNEENKKEDKDEIQFYNSNLLNIREAKFETTTEAWRNPLTCKGYCPDEDPDDRTVLLENKDCTKYCSCSNGNPIVNKCPAGLHFSWRKQTCTWPKDAKCPQIHLYQSEPKIDWLLSPRDY